MTGPFHVGQLVTFTGTGSWMGRPVREGDPLVIVKTFFSDGRAPYVEVTSPAEGWSEYVTCPYLRALTPPRP